MNPIRSVPRTARALAIPSCALLAALGLGACADRPAAPGEPARTIPAGKGNWVSVDEALPLDGLIDQDVTLPYGGEAVTARSGAAKGAVVGYRAVLRATPLTPEDRCGMDLRQMVVVYGDGTTAAVPAHGYVQDNSDGRRGFRVELAPGADRRLVIPAQATATVFFTEPVALPAP